MRKPYILITNDDGIHAPGIHHLYNAIKDHTDCVISAPFVEKSGAGLSTTLTKPLQIHTIPWDIEKDIKAYRINGTPSDCVKLALKVILKKKPDMIISGINLGCNAGRTVLYSGTIGAVIEGTHKKIPGIAFSITDIRDPDFSQTEKYIFPIIEYILKNPLDKGCFLNVNFPSSKKFPSFKGIKMASQGASYWKENPSKRLHPEGHHYYWMGTKWHEEKEEENSDIYYLNNGYIAAVPIQIAKLSCERQISKHKENFENFLSHFTNEKPLVIN